MSDTNKTLLVTCALPYANGSIHLGHILEHIQADIYVRFQRMLGRKVYFVCADNPSGSLRSPPPFTQGRLRAGALPICYPLHKGACGAMPHPLTQGRLWAGILSKEK